MISCVVGILSLGSRHSGKSFQFYGDTNNPNPQTFRASRNTQRREKQVILFKIRCKMTESLSKAGNDETKNLIEHACKTKWDGLYSRYTVSNKYH